MDTVLPDAGPKNWVDRHAPPPLRPWLRLARLDRPTGIWLLMLPGWQGIALAHAMRGAWPNPWLLGAFLVGAVLMRAAGCAVNDVADKDFDARVARTAGRPVASGQLSRKAALAFALACTVGSLAILLFLNLASFWLAAAALPLVAAYPFMKRITWWPQAWLGLTFNWGALLGYAAAQGGEPLLGRLGLAAGAPAPIGEAWAPALLLYASGVAWTLGYDTIYAVQDIEDDALVGVKSTARRLGRHVPAFVAGAYLVTLVLAAAAGRAGGLGPIYLPCLLAPGFILAIQLRGLRGAEPTRALAAFKANTWVGVALFVALALGRFNSSFTTPG
ncbi:MAG TPA: 4-hydroxybenzoate octaprenyltransferase [Caulobacteraceae bacterium]|nr:4-hydroxybenzoate octaprenyltransferase [Caulobacteraceae bacterium]